MGLNNDKNEGFVNLNIELFKTCYFPGESINGMLILTPKPGIIDANFTDTQSNFTILERKFYKFNQNDQIYTSSITTEDNILLKKEFNFNNFLNESLLLEIKIPFSLILPTNAYPSCLFSGPPAYVSHSLKVEFPNLKVSTNKIFSLLFFIC